MFFLSSPCLGIRTLWTSPEEVCRRYLETTFSALRRGIDAAKQQPPSYAAVFAPIVYIMVLDWTIRMQARLKQLFNPFSFFS